MTWDRVIFIQSTINKQNNEMDVCSGLAGCLLAGLEQAQAGGEREAGLGECPNTCRGQPCQQEAD